MGVNMISETPIDYTNYAVHNSRVRGYLACFGRPKNKLYLI